MSRKQDTHVLTGLVMVHPPGQLVIVKVVAEVTEYVVPAWVI